MRIMGSGCLCYIVRLDSNSIIIIIKTEEEKYKGYLILAR